MPAPLTWDDTGKRIYETGTKKGVLFPTNSDGTYANGVAWNGLTGVTESPSGADETALWADDTKYASLRSAEDFGGTIEAYTCPVEFYECNGMAQPAPGVTINQQSRKPFGFSYVTTIGNDVSGTEYGYKIHLVYGATVSPSEVSYQTINDSPDAITMSWEFTTVPVSVTGYKQCAHLVIDSTKFVTADEKTALENFKKTLYGSTTADSTLPMPDAVIAALTVS